MSDHVFLKELQCKHCKLEFYICRKCYRGQVYCSSSCRDKAHLKAHRQRQSRYRATKKGREAHCRNEKMRRMGKNKKTMADEGTNPPGLRLILYPILRNTKPRCSFCGAYGKVVEVFPPR